MEDNDDFQQEVSRGLAKALPPGERILWQGAPQVWALARDAMCARWIVGYFALLAVWRGLALGQGDPAAGAAAAVFYVGLGLAATGIVLGIAWVLARTTVYTITTARIVLRIGAALTVSLNLPLKHVASAGLSAERDGTGSIHLDLTGSAKISYLVLWPHVRPWAIARPQPTLRAIPDARAVAAILAQAAHDGVGAVITEMPEPAAAPGAVTVPAE